jgi:5-bromo-4-chloroindolyl phosphate hydrolysis protein
MYYNQTVLYLQLYQELIIDGVTVQEDYIDTMPIINTKEYYKADEYKKLYEQETQNRQTFLNNINLTDKQYRYYLENSLPKREA